MEEKKAKQIFQKYGFLIEQVLDNLDCNPNFQYDLNRLLICYRMGLSWKGMERYIQASNVKFDEKCFRVK